MRQTIGLAEASLTDDRDSPIAVATGSAMVLAGRPASLGAVEA
jgi:hypothetical protein